MTSASAPTETELPALTVVTPCYREEEVIGLFLDALLKVADQLKQQCEFRVLVCDDGSTDGTCEVLAEWEDRDPRVSWLTFSRNFGHQAALAAGLEHAPPGAVVMMDSDLEHPPEVLLEMVARWRAGVDVVSGVRRQPEGLGWTKKITSNLFYSVFNRLSETQLQPGAADFTLLSERARQALATLPEYHRFTRAMVAWLGFKREYVPYDQPVRPRGESKYTASKMLRLAARGVFSFSTRPIYLLFAASLTITAVGFGYLLYAIYVRLSTDTATEGWTSLMAVVLLLGGWQTLTTALLGIYVARVFEQVKGRPQYVLKSHPGEQR